MKEYIKFIGTAHKIELDALFNTFRIGEEWKDVAVNEILKVEAPDRPELDGAEAVVVAKAQGSLGQMLRQHPGLADLGPDAVQLRSLMEDFYGDLSYDPSCTVLYLVMHRTGDIFEELVDDTDEEIEAHNAEVDRHNAEVDDHNTDDPGHTGLPSQSGDTADEEETAPVEKTDDPVGSNDTVDPVASTEGDDSPGDVAEPDAKGNTDVAAVDEDGGKVDSPLKDQDDIAG